MPTVPVEGDPFLKPVAGDPFAEGMTLTGNVAQVAKQLESDEAARRQKLQSMVESGPGHVAAPNPYPPGSEEWEFYEQSRQSNISASGARAALNTIGRGVPMAQPGSLGAAGGGIKAFHGSPHDFEKFDVSKIGTGEGAQVYGHGLYFAENEETAKSYRALGSSYHISDADLQKAVGDAVPLNRQYAAAIRLAADSKDTPERAAFNLQARHPELRDTGSMMEVGPKRKALTEAVAKAQDVGRGRMYEVNINADPEHFLDWDKPLSEQHPKVQEKLKDIGGLDLTAKDMKKHPEQLLEGLELAFHQPGKGHLDRAAVAEALNDRGIPGIKYLDQGSRSKGEGTHNYVVFHHSIVDILKKYGLAGLVAGGAAHFKTQPHEGDPFAASQ